MTQNTFYRFESPPGTKSKKEKNMDNKFIAIFVLGFIAMMGFITYLGLSFVQRVEARRDLCAEAGGISLVGDKGHYKLCLRPEAVIELPNE